MKKRVGLIGWRGLVGSVLLQRMNIEGDFSNIDPCFLSTSKFGNIYNILNKNYFIENAYDLDVLSSMDIILTCQGSEYTELVYPKLRDLDWKGYWIDAASFLRTKSNSVIVLDPINDILIKNSISNGIKTFVGGNCTVSLMLMALGGLFSADLIEWVSVATYQAASGGGAKCILELLSQMGYMYNTISNKINNFTPVTDIMHDALNSTLDQKFPDANFTVPLSGNVIPWIDQVMSNGQSREEWKMQFETNKILNSKYNISIDGICVRISSLRSHSQYFTIKLKKDLSLEMIQEIIKSHNPWVDIISNNDIESKRKLTPLSVSETLRIPVGRIRKMNIGRKYFSVFTVGDQLLWGAAEPLRRMLNILLNFI